MAQLIRLALALFLLASGFGSARAGVPPQPASTQVTPTLVTPTLATPTQAAAKQESFAAFWPRFRKGLLAGDMDRLSRLAQFPLEVRGTLDSDAVRRIPRSQFSTVITSILAEDSGLSVAQPETNRALIERLPQADPRQRGVSISADTARIGPLDFARQASDWRLVRLYHEDDN